MKKQENVEQVIEQVIDNSKGTTSAPPMPEELSQEQALNVLIQAVKIAVKRGAFELEETEVLLKAIKVFTPSK